MEAVRRMLADDPEMKPGDGIEAIKKKYGLEMSPANFSAYKSQTRAKAGEGAGKGKGKGGRPKAAPTKAPAAGASGADPLEAAQQVKALVGRYGADTVKGLADLFGKGQG